MTDAQWERIRRYVPVHPLGRLPRNLRRQIDGVNWRFRTGSPWRDLPERYGNWNTVYQRFCDWRDDGTWLAILIGIIADAEELGDIDWFVAVDSTTNRAHQHAAGAVFTPEQLAEAQAWLDTKANPANQKTNVRFIPATGTHPSPTTQARARTRRARSAASSANTARPAPEPPNSAAPGAD
jgi:transposase